MLSVNLPHVQTLTIVMLNAIVLKGVMLCNITECLYAECHVVYLSLL
jgi:hypothetical protein